MTTNKLDVPAMCVALKDLTRWKVFANHLRDIETSEIDTIEQDEPQSVEKKNMALFSKWLQVCPGASWSDVASALRIRENKLAEEIESKYLTKDTSGIGSYKFEHAEDDPPYVYHTPESETQNTTAEYQRIQGSLLHLPSGQQETQKQNSTEKNRKRHSYMSPELKKEQVQHKQTNQHKQTLLNEREELQAEVEELKNKIEHSNIENQNYQQEIEKADKLLRDEQQKHQQEIVTANKNYQKETEKANRNYQQELEKAKQLLKDEQQKHKQKMDTLATENNQQKIKIRNIRSEHNRLGRTNGSLITELNEVKSELNETNSEAITKINKLEEELKEGNLRFENTKLMMIKVASLIIRNVASSMILFVSLMIAVVSFMMIIVVSSIILFWLLTHFIPLMVIVMFFLYFFFVYNFMHKN